MGDLVTWADNKLIIFSLGVQDWIYGSNGHGARIVTALIFGAIAYYVGGKIVARIVRRLVRTTRHREWHRKDVEKRQKTLSALFRNMWHIIVILLTIYAVLRQLLPDTDQVLAPLFASAGILGVAFGFGAQSVIKDFLAGIFIISENQYRVGDIVDIEGASGTVERIGTRSTVIRDVDGNVHYLPNGMITHVINKTMGYSMARFIIAIDPASDIDVVAGMIDAIGAKLAQEDKWKNKILEPPAFVSIGELTGTSVEVIVAGKTQPSDQWAVVAEMRRRLLQELEEKGVKLAIVPGFPVTAASKKK